MSLKNVRRFGEWALITGASSGIGEALARALAAEGVNVALVARNKAALETLAGELERGSGVKALAIPCDLAREGAVDAIEAALGEINIDILVNNAGFGSSGAFHEIPAGTDEGIVAVNCLATVALTRRFLPAMVLRGRGALIFLSSIAAAVPTPACATYAASKAFDLYLGEALHGELKGTGVACLSVRPGATLTGFQDRASYKKEAASRSPAQVAATALRALGRKRTVTDGFANKVLVALTGMMPRGLAIAVAARFNDSIRAR